VTEPASCDAFISHASEDKDRFVRPLAEALTSLGARIWYDEFALKPGMSLSKSIDHGLANCLYGLVVISPSFIGKAWPERELQGLVARRIAGKATIVPIWHDVDFETVLQFSPPLADIRAIRTSDGAGIDIALQVLAVIRPDLYAAHPRAELERRASGEALSKLADELDAVREHLSEFQCPYCGADLASRIPAPVDDLEKHWDEVVIYECGFEEFGGELRHPCPSDPRYPAFTDYELRTHEIEPGHWIAHALGVSAFAKRVSIREGWGSTPDRAIAEIKRNYREFAPERLHATTN
jgi:predicted RNA-binding Zn-ribbon protein involved in translation (DUF1610 family)